MIFSIKKKIREASYRSKFIRSMYINANSVRTKLMKSLSDEKFAKIKYKENTGRNLQLDPPKTFNEKLWWLKINNRDPLLTQCSDKVLVRDYVKQKGLEEILIPVIGVYDRAEDIDFDTLPNRAIIKANHCSGKNIIWDRNKPFNRSEFIRQFNETLKENYYHQSREWNYKHITPRLIVEQLIVENPKDSLYDWRILCFDGKAQLIFLDIETAAEDGSHYPFAKRNVYDTDFNYLDIKVSREQFDRDFIAKPDRFDQMLEYAERLSEPFVFARVDLYNVDGKIYFGEITFYPGGCCQIAEPEKYENELGSWIDLQSRKIIKKTTKKD